MHKDHKIFIQAIKDRKKVLIKHRTDEDRNTRTRVCRPLFYIPASSQSGCTYYYFWGDEKEEKGNILRIAAEHVAHIGPTQESFDSAGFTLVSEEELSRKDSRSFDSLEHKR